MSFKGFLVLLSSLFVAIPAFSGMVKGFVTNTKNEPLPFASVFVTGTTHGTSTNLDGYFELHLAEGRHELGFRYVGYQKKTVEIEISANPLTLNVQLETDQIMLQEVVISADAEDPAYPIIRKAIAKRKFYLEQIENYTCNAYTKGIFRMTEAPDKFFGDSLNTKNDSILGIFYLSESESKLDFQQPDQMKEEMISSRVSGDPKGFGINFISFFLLDFYNNNIKLPIDRSERGFISPIANSALFYYDYRLEGSFLDDSSKVYKIRVMGKRKADPVFNGHIYIVDGSWRIHSVDLMITKDANVEFVDSVNIQKTLAPANDSLWTTITQKLHLYFSINFFGKRFAGNGMFHSQFTNYRFDNEFGEKYFKNEVIKVDPEANKKDSAYWEKNRPIPLTGEELVNYEKEDSLLKKRQSREYLDSLDRKSNRPKWGNLLNGYSYYRRIDSTRFSVNSPLTTLQFNTVQGWNVGLKFDYSRNFSDERRFFVGQKIGYGFSNQRWIYNVDIASNYNREKFSAFRISAGIMPAQYNQNEPISPLINSLYTLLDENNFMKVYQKSYLQLGHSTEIVNGIFLRVSANYADRKPLVNTTNFRWVDYDSREFTSNDPQKPDSDSEAFEQNQSLTLHLAATYRFRQKYISVPHKVILGSKYPDLTFSYTKGFIGVLSSDVDFDLITLKLEGRMKLGLFGESHYEGIYGTFVNNRKMEFMDFYHFNGNRTIVANDAFNAFQLLDYYKYSNNTTWAEACFEHNFNGFIINKIPLLRKTKWRALAGVRYLTVDFENDYIEFNVGVKNIFKVLRIDFVTSFEKGNRARTGIVFKFNPNN